MMALNKLIFHSNIHGKLNWKMNVKLSKIFFKHYVKIFYMQWPTVKKIK